MATNREAKILKERREELGLTQQEIAMEVGLSLQQYQRYEYGSRRLSNSAMKLGLKICAVLELDPYEFTFRDDKDFASPIKK